MAWHWYRGKHQRVNTDWDRPRAKRPDFRLEALNAWERRWRGWDLFAEPVALEPAFARYEPNVPLQEAGWDRLPQPLDMAGGEFTALAVLTVPGEKVTANQADAFLSACRGCSGPLALEVIATSRRIAFQVIAPVADAATITAAFGTIFPLARLEPVDDLLREALAPLFAGSRGYKVVDWGLYDPAYRPLRIFESLLLTPQAGLISQLGSLSPGEVAGIQLLLEPATSPWGDSMAELVMQFDGSDPSIVRSARQKLGSPLWAAGLRVFGAVAGGSDEAAFDLCRRIGDTLAVLGEPSPDGLPSNRLIPLDDSNYPPHLHLQDLLERRSRRTGMLLCQDELPGLWHPPAPHVVHPKLWRYDPAARELPEELREACGAYLGALDLPEAMLTPDAEPMLVPWPDAFRNRHAYLLGATRMGKSTLLLNLIAQDLLAGRGLCLIDPHGDLAHDVLDRVPSGREEDVLFVDLSDTAYPPAVGLLEAGDEWEERLLVSDLLAILHRLFRASWGDRLEHILRHALLTLLADPEPHTLRDIRPLLANKPYREQVLRRLRDTSLRGFWHGDYQSYSSTAFSPVYNKLGLLMSSPTVRNVISGTESRLHPGDLIRDRRVLIVNLAQSLIGEDNAHFLGALLVSKIQLAAMHNLRRGRSDRTEFTLYVDEFQNFVVSSFEKILSEAGKAGLSLVMANQFLEQLSDGLQTAILSNAGTLVSFRVSAESGRRLEPEFGGFYGAKQLANKEPGRAVVRLGRAGDSYAIRTFPPVGPDVLNARPGAREDIIDQTREEVCRPRREVEAEFRRDEEALEELLRQAEEQEEAAKARKSATEAPKARKEKAAATNPAKEEGDEEAGDLHTSGPLKAGRSARSPEKKEGADRSERGRKDHGGSNTSGPEEEEVDEPTTPKDRRKAKARSGSKSEANDSRRPKSKRTQGEDQSPTPQQEADRGQNSVSHERQSGQRHHVEAEAEDEFATPDSGPTQPVGDHLNDEGPAVPEPTGTAFSSETDPSISSHSEPRGAQANHGQKEDKVEEVSSDPADSAVPAADAGEASPPIFFGLPEEPEDGAPAPEEDQ